jgi:general secretion pathway protein I
MPRIGKPPGFTLIEILIALTVFAITSSALISGLTRHVYQSALLRDKTIAHWVAENEVSQIRGPAYAASQQGTGNLARAADEPRYFPDIGTKRKEVTMGDMDWQVKISVSSTQNKDIRRITVDVYSADSEDDGTSVVTLDGFAGRF